jgi:hypothetical protein
MRGGWSGCGDGGGAGCGIGPPQSTISMSCTVLAVSRSNWIHAFSVPRDMHGVCDAPSVHALSTHALVLAVMYWCDSTFAESLRRSGVRPTSCNVRSKPSIISGDIPPEKKTRVGTNSGIVSIGGAGGGGGEGGGALLATKSVSHRSLYKAQPAPKNVEHAWLLTSSKPLTPAAESANASQDGAQTGKSYKKNRSGVGGGGGAGGGAGGAGG